MKTFYSCILFILIMANSNAQSNPFQLMKDHDALQVKDLDTSAKFYGEVLGLEEIPNGGLPDHIRWFQLGDKVQIHLIESEYVPEINKGVHMSLSTNKLNELMDFLISENIDFENWPGEPNTTNTRPDGVKQIYLQDPDGYWIEINDGSL
ncbi:VOC family protein [Gramella sp. MT6]|uniref:VOC family protein n=1 Tax=Gramella sp. MT6 TaxID=2705471 RepID=UPI001C6068F1|nr:VOC family protein [Gramella sp. MT6]QYA25268.1 VOC family protein [Gramella sp. MT6]